MGEGETRVGEGETRVGEGETRVGEGETRVGEGETRVGEGETKGGRGRRVAHDGSPTHGAMGRPVRAANGVRHAEPKTSTVFTNEGESKSGIGLDAD